METPSPAGDGDQGSKDGEMGDFVEPSSSTQDLSDEGPVEKLVAMGFSTEDATKALSSSNGDERAAVSVLMGEAGTADNTADDKTASDPQVDEDRTLADQLVAKDLQKLELLNAAQREKQAATGTSSSRFGLTKTLSGKGFLEAGRGLVGTAAMLGRSVENSLENASNMLDKGIDTVLDKAKEKKVSEKVASVKESSLKTFSSLGSVFGKTASVTAAATAATTSAARSFNPAKLMTSTAQGLKKSTSISSSSSSKELSEPVSSLSMPKGQVATAFCLHESRVICAYGASRGKLGGLLSSSTGPGHISFWNEAGTGGLEFAVSGSLPQTKSPICAMAAAEGLLALGDRAGGVFIVQGLVAEMGKEGVAVAEMVPFTPHGGEVSALHHSRRYGTIISASLDGFVRVHRIEQKTVAAEFSAPGEVTGVALHPDEKRVILSCSSGCLCVGVANVVPAPPLEVDDSRGHRGQSVECVAVSADGGRVVSGGADRQVIVWSLVASQLELLLVLPSPVLDPAWGGPVASITFCGSGITVAAGHASGAGGAVGAGGLPACEPAAADGGEAGGARGAERA
eukprot:CAMPEP_0181333552 /NCGR_PEP_ID=MMETSP1101-20121128/25742_1 /TAXON_ID=46948 /ORGANISM="Rhodomonas abbreviata, Strain Caron Lab Isolate" /LENGTH=569 /DNA_ID=CAMNT_0023443379 /DNA_START=27 /DNA_END=1732 /DNA_ORIENTATION=+